MLKQVANDSLIKVLILRKLQTLLFNHKDSKAQSRKYYTFPYQYSIPTLSLGAFVVKIYSFILSKKNIVIFLMIKHAYENSA